MASIRKRKNSYQVIVSMGYGPNGKRISRPTKTLHPPKGLTPRKEKEWVTEQAVLFEYGIKQGNAPTEKNITVYEYYSHFEKEILPGKVGVSTQKRIRHDMERLLPLIGYYKLRSLNKPIIRTVYEKMKKLPNQRTGGLLAEKTLAGMHACLCSVLSSAVEEGYIDKNPAWRCWKWHGECRPACKAADEETVKKILCALENENPLYSTYYKIVLATGMRRGECCGLRWGDIDFEEGCITVLRAVVGIKNGAIVTAPKTKAGCRDIYVSETLLKQISCYKRWVKKNRWPLSRKIRSTDYLFFRKSDVTVPMFPNIFTNYFRKFVVKNELPSWLTVHSLRHTNASLQIAQGVDVCTVASNLGHADVSTTLDIYSHAFDRTKKDAQQKLEKVLGI